MEDNRMALKVSGLPATVSELFSRFGTLLGVKVYAKNYLDKFAIVIFANEESAEKVRRALDGAGWGEDTIKVE